jgi:hypothetical protein
MRDCILYVLEIYPRRHSSVPSYAMQYENTLLPTSHSFHSIPIKE